MKLRVVEFYHHNHGLFARKLYNVVMTPAVKALRIINTYFVNPTTLRKETVVQQVIIIV